MCICRRHRLLRLCLVTAHNSSGLTFFLCPIPFIYTVIASSVSVEAMPLEDLRHCQLKYACLIVSPPISLRKERN